MEQINTNQIGANLYSKLPVAPFLCNKSMVLGGWMDVWMDGWIDEWMDGWQSRVKDCLQQSKTRKKPCCNYILVV